MRGRPAGQMTVRRQQVLAIIEPAALMGVRINYCEIARRCDPPLYDARDAKRIVRELQLVTAAI